MSRERRFHALVQSLAELAEALNDPDRNTLIDRVWPKLRTMLDWMYHCEEGERAETPDYYDRRAASNEGLALAGLIWVRGLIVHRQAQPEVIAIYRARQQVGFSLGPSGLNVREQTAVAGGLTWVQRNQLPAGPVERHGRDVAYDSFVGGQPLLQPLADAIDFLNSFNTP